MREWIVAGLACVSLLGCGGSDENTGQPKVEASVPTGPEASAPDQQKPKPEAKRGDECSDAQCQPGDKVKLRLPKGEKAFLCKTETTSDYVTTVFGMVSLQMTLTGKRPQISPDTGEPVYDGDSKRLMDHLRGRANVSTFDEALAMCREGRNGQVFTVMNSVKSTTSIWVAGKDGVPVWTSVVGLVKQ